MDLSAKKQKAIVAIFCELVKIPSPSGNEQEVIRFIKHYLAKYGIKSYSDNVGRKIDSNSGNLIAKIGHKKPILLFVAHVDTVEDGKKKIRPIIQKNRITSDGKSILGSDDKAGVAALLEALKELRQERSPPTVIAVFAIREESGVMGVKLLKLKEKVDFAFDIDGSYSPGKFIHKALG